MNCPTCKSEHTVKNGIAKQKQRYLCKNCNYQFLDYENKESLSIKNASKRKALHLFLEGLSLREVARILQIAPTTLANWKKEWKSLSLKAIENPTKPENLDYPQSIKYIKARKNTSTYAMLWLDLETDVSFINKL